jgi:transposase
MMGYRLAVTWPVTAEELARRARRTPDGRQRTRLIAVRLLLQGQSVPQAAAAVGVNERRVRNWVHRFNREGPGGLADRPRPGRPRTLTPEQEQAFAARLEAGPAEDEGRAAYRGPDATRILAEEFAASYSSSGTYNLLQRLGFASLVPRPRHPKSDADAQATFQKRPSRRP